MYPELHFEQMEPMDGANLHQFPGVAAWKPSLMHIVNSVIIGISLAGCGGGGGKLQPGDLATARSNGVPVEGADFNGHNPNGVNCRLKQGEVARVTSFPKSEYDTPDWREKVSVIVPDQPGCVGRVDVERLKLVTPTK